MMGKIISPSLASGPCPSSDAPEVSGWELNVQEVLRVRTLSVPTSLHSRSGGVGESNSSGGCSCGHLSCLVLHHYFLHFSLLLFFGLLEPLLMLLHQSGDDSGELLVRTNGPCLGIG